MSAQAPEAVLARPAVLRVRAALEAAHAEGRPVVLAATARTAEDAARALGVAVGQIVKSLLFLLGERPVLVLVAGDRRCRPELLPELLGLEGRVVRADAETVRRVSGFAIGGVAPIGHLEPSPCAIDASLGRFDRLWAAAGHPHAVFPTSLAELARLTRGVVDARIAEAG
ncbi:MAG: YbaK/EbsC family protein [Geminicoccaceae bacterium]|nr:YbaK/EbsC family protein [Geminicoccaceae bacterium]MCX8101677.1 YbaK/EbsC family protein [Geminicoccaceae bacterium]MDW8371394.1 YbaK/EbsC family protein [Geminicoccaceae bacterium]